MTSVLTLFIKQRHSELSGTAEKLESSEASYHYEAIKLRYHEGVYQLLEGNEVINLLDGHCLPLNSVTVTVQLDHMNTVTSKTHVSDKPAPIIFNNNQSDRTLTKLKELSPTEYELIKTNNTQSNDKLSFLQQLNDKAQEGLQFTQNVSIASNQKSPSHLNILEQYYQPPQIVNELNGGLKSRSFQSYELAINDPSMQQGNILRDLGFIS